MYIGIGKGKFLNSKDIIGIFDLDITSQSHITRKYLAASEKAGLVINSSEDIPKSFVISKDKGVYLSQMATSTLNKRIEEVK